MVGEQAGLTGAIMDACGPPSEGDKTDRSAHAVTVWTSDRAETVRQVRRAVEEVEKAPGGWSFAKLTIANAALRELAAA